MMTRIERWQDLINALLGLWLLVSPWVIGDVDGSAAMWNAVIAGLVLAALALGAMVIPRAWEEWAQGAIGAWLIGSPWVLAFSERQGPMLNAMWVGIAVVALALWTLLADKERSASHAHETPAAR
jgi:hypothetical protein